MKFTITEATKSELELEKARKEEAEKAGKIFEPTEYKTYDVEFRSMSWQEFKPLQKKMEKEPLEAGEDIVNACLKKGNLSDVDYAKLKSDANLMQALIKCAFQIFHNYDVEIKKN